MEDVIVSPHQVGPLGGTRRASGGNDTLHGSRYDSHPCAVAAIMSFEAALSLPILELLQVLRKKLTLEYTRVREIRLPPGVASVSVLEAEVSTPRSISFEAYLQERRHV